MNEEDENDNVEDESNIVMNNLLENILLRSLNTTSRDENIRDIRSGMRGNQNRPTEEVENTNLQMPILNMFNSILNMHQPPPVPITPPSVPPSSLGNVNGMPNIDSIMRTMETVLPPDNPINEISSILNFVDTVVNTSLSSIEDDILNTVMMASMNEKDELKPDNAGVIDLTIFKFKNSFSQESCSICLENFSEGEDISKTNCAHFYHENCIRNWAKYRYDCPVCRENIPLKNNISHI